MKDYIENCRNNLSKLEEQKSVLEQEVADADTCVNQINQDLENVMNKLGSASIEKTESRRQQKRKELIEKLKARDIDHTLDYDTLSSTHHSAALRHVKSIY